MEIKRTRAVLYQKMGAFLMDASNFTRGSVTINDTQDADVKKAIALPILMFAGGAVGNIIAIVVLSISRQERKSSAFYTLVCGLAVTDLLGTCLASPITIANYLNPDVLQHSSLCEVQSFLLLFFGLGGLSIICAMSTERYLAICCPYTYQRWGVDRCFAKKTLCTIYIINILFCSLPMMGMSSSELQNSLTWCFINWRAQDPLPATYSFLYGSVSLMLILVSIVLNFAVCVTLLIMRQRTIQRPVIRASVRERWRALSSAAETQMIAVLVVTSVVVVVCSAPLVVRVFDNQMHGNNFKADLAAIRIASVNPILDPWIYILLRKSLFRRILTLSKRFGKPHARNSLSSTARRRLLLDGVRDSHVFTQLLQNANAVSQIPATVTFKECDTININTS